MGKRIDSIIVTHTKEWIDERQSHLIKQSKRYRINSSPFVLAEAILPGLIRLASSWELNLK